jgi:redox-sensitive bicupin YhaK (pirin superfamily)
MTAGSGIIHQEMPKKSKEIWGIQLWVNLPSYHKMMNPRYRGITAEHIPEIKTKQGVKIKVISGELNGTRGPIEDLVVEIEYLDITINPCLVLEHNVKRGFKSFAYIIEGNGYLDQQKERLISLENLVVFEDGDRVKITAGEKGLRFLLISGEPIGEPVAWYGPIVMNTQEELERAFEEYQNGTFIKTSK